MPKTKSKSPNKSAFVRSLPADMSAKDVVAKAKAGNIVLTENYVYTIRSAAKNKSKKGGTGRGPGRPKGSKSGSSVSSGGSSRPASSSTRSSSVSAMPRTLARLRARIRPSALAESHRLSSMLDGHETRSREKAKAGFQFKQGVFGRPRAQAMRAVITLRTREIIKGSTFASALMLHLGL